MYLKDEHNITCKYTRFQTIGKSTFILQQLKLFRILDFVWRNIKMYLLEEHFLCQIIILYSIPNSFKCFGT